MRTEFEFIDDMRSRYGLRTIGDDCAVLPKDSVTDQVVTADLLIEDVDFRLEWTKPEYLGHKALAVSLSDIAAMGAGPKWALLSIGIAENLWKTDFLDRFYAGWHALANKYGVELVGGDLSKSPDKLVIDSIVGGEVPKGKAILRSGARTGDAVYVTGSLGGAAGGLALLESGGESVPLAKKQLCPTPQLTIAKRVQQHQLASAMIDLSDGLSSDLRHLCEASGVGARIEASRLPIDLDLSAHFTDDQRREMALNGGEDLELLFTANSVSVSAANLPNITRIGEITSNPEIELVDGNDVRLLEARGYQHFS